MGNFLFKKIISTICISLLCYSTSKLPPSIVRDTDNNLLVHRGKQTCTHQTCTRQTGAPEDEMISGDGKKQVLCMQG